MTSPRYTQNPDTPVTVIAGEAAIVTPWDQRIHLLDPIATVIWSLCESADGRTMAELVDTLVDDFDAERAVIVRDTEAFVTNAVELGLLTRLG
jgi:hypothetical protein